MRLLGLFAMHALDSHGTMGGSSAQGSVMAMRATTIGSADATEAQGPTKATNPAPAAVRADINTSVPQLVLNGGTRPWT